MCSLDSPNHVQPNDTPLPEFCAGSFVSFRSSAAYSVMSEPDYDVCYGFSCLSVRIYLPHPAIVTENHYRLTGRACAWSSYNQLVYMLPPPAQLRTLLCDNPCFQTVARGGVCPNSPSSSPASHVCDLKGLFSRPTCGREVSLPPPPRPEVVETYQNASYPSDSDIGNSSITPPFPPFCPTAVQLVHTVRY